MFQKQACTAPCIHCRKPGVAYLLTSEGPWALDRDHSTCTFCGAEHEVSLKVKSPSETGVTVKLLKKPQ